MPSPRSSFVAPSSLVRPNDRPSHRLARRHCATPAPSAALGRQPDRTRNHGPTRTRSPRLRPRPPAPPAPPNARLTPILTLSRTDYVAKPQQVSASPFWRAVLLSDGHLPHHLSIFTGHPLQLTHLHTTASAAAPHTSHTPVPVLPQPPVRRSVCMTDPNRANETVLYATSSWDAQSHADIMAGREDTPLYLVFEALRLRVSRTVTHVHYGVCPGVARAFGLPDDTLLWARDTVFRRNGLTFVAVHEILSPRMDQYLGKLHPPPAVVSAIERRSCNDEQDDANASGDSGRSDDSAVFSPHERLVERDDDLFNLHPDGSHQIANRGGHAAGRDSRKAHEHVLSEDPRAGALGIRL